MTIIPNPDQFEAVEHRPVSMTGPIVRDYYWGIVVSPFNRDFGLPELARLAAVLVIFGCLIASPVLLVLPETMISPAAGASKWVASVTLLCLAGLLLPLAMRSTLVDVHIDTQSGEILEIQEGAWGSRKVLARYGMDSVADVRLVRATSRRDAGQIQIELKDGTAIPAGEGSIDALASLRSRLAREIGIERSRQAAPVTWNGRPSR